MWEKTLRLLSLIENVHIHVEVVCYLKLFISKKSYLKSSLFHLVLNQVC